MSIMIKIIIGYCIVIELLGWLIAIVQYFDEKKFSWRNVFFALFLPILMPYNIIKDYIYGIIHRKDAIKYAEGRQKKELIEQELNQKYPIEYYYITFESLPFTPSKRQIIYIEQEYNESINSKIRDNYGAICKMFQEEGFSFLYLPLFNGKELDEAKQNYYAPYSHAEYPKYEGLQSTLLLDYFKETDTSSGEIKPSLMCFDFQDGETSCFYAWTICDSDDFLYAFNRLKNEVADDVINGRVRFRTLDIDNDDKEEYTQELIPIDPEDEEIEEAIRRLESTVEKLQTKGITLAAIHEMIDRRLKLSRMVITPDNRIILPDYDNMEIKITAIAKALYFLFLRYPEGIVLKTLPDYYTELLNIYKELKPNFKQERLEMSIRDLVNPCSNSMNEKISVIRSAFVCMFDVHLAKNYFISGSAGESYKIPLDRNLIEWLEI